MESLVCNPHLRFSGRFAGVTGCPVSASGLDETGAPRKRFQDSLKFICSCQGSSPAGEISLWLFHQEVSWPLYLKQIIA
jgi:hypothetical protein